MNRVLVDTGVWIDHLHQHEERLEFLLKENGVVVHPVVLGELACGSLKNRKQVLGYLRMLQSAGTASDEECHFFIDEYRLWGKGLGWGDVQLLAAARLGGYDIWSRDKSLNQVALRLGVKGEGSWQ